MSEETTSTNTSSGDEEYKGTDGEIDSIDTREALAKYGAEHLPNEKLLAVLISSGYNKNKAIEIADNLLQAFHRSLIDVFSASIHQLTQVKGIGFVKACKIKAAFELAKRTASYYEEENPKITSAENVVKLMAPRMRHLKQEEFRVLLLNSKKRLIRHCRVSLGSLDAALVHPREVFRPAVTASAAYIVVVHNHPSGDPTPSEQDIVLTQQLCLSGKVVGIDVLDHVIIGFTTYVSLKEQGEI